MGNPQYKLQAGDVKTKQYNIFNYMGMFVAYEGQSEVALQ